jgi:hypothetical protein
MKEFIIMIAVLLVLTIAGFGLIFYKTNSSTENTVVPFPLGKAEYVAQCAKWVGNGFHGKTCAEFIFYKIEE